MVYIKVVKVVERILFYIEKDADICRYHFSHAATVSIFEKKISFQLLYIVWGYLTNQQECFLSDTIVAAATLRSQVFSYGLSCV